MDLPYPFSRLEKDGGITVQSIPINGVYHVPSYSRGFWVGGASRVIIIPFEELTKEKLFRNLKKFHKYKFIGLWISPKNELHIEATTYVNNRYDALLLAKKRKQFSIYSIANNIEIVT